MIIFILSPAININRWIHLWSVCFGLNDGWFCYFMPSKHTRKIFPPLVLYRANRFGWLLFHQVLNQPAVFHYVQGAVWMQNDMWTCWGKYVVLWWSLREKSTAFQRRLRPPCEEPVVMSTLSLVTNYPVSGDCYSHYKKRRHMQKGQEKHKQIETAAWDTLTAKHNQKPSLASCQVLFKR